MLQEALEDLKRKVQTLVSPKREEPDDPDAPFAMVAAPLIPRRPLNRSSIAVQPEQ